jgi:hypothetical protein
LTRATTGSSSAAFATPAKGAGANGALTVNKATQASAPSARTTTGRRMAQEAGKETDTETDMETDPLEHNPSGRNLTLW